MLLKYFDLISDPYVGWNDASFVAVVFMIVFKKLRLLRVNDVIKNICKDECTLIQNFKV